MGDLDYNGLYEYLYEMKYHRKFTPEKYPKGIPGEDFEKLLTEYLPITGERIRQYAVFDRKKQTYAWVRLGCFNYTLNAFGNSVPEVTGVGKNRDGTMILRVDAVCEMMLCDEAVITQEVTVRCRKDGTFQYMGNRILKNGIKEIPAYEYRINKRKLQ